MFKMCVNPVALAFTPTQNRLVHFASQRSTPETSSASPLSVDEASPTVDFKLARRVNKVTPSMIRAVSRVAAQYPDVINLGQGTPSDNPPQPVIQAAQKALETGHNQYTNVWGDEGFRKAIAQKYSSRLDFPIDPDKHVTVLCGVTEAVFSAIYALVDKGDEVLLLEPRYDNYLPAIVWNRGKPKFVPLKAPNDSNASWSLDEKALEAAITPKTKVLLLNNPHNPTGKVFTKPELETIAALCKKHNLIAVTDEIYEHLLFDGRKHHYLASLPGMKDRTITISGLSKAYDATGWRVAYTIAPPKLTDAIRKTHDFLTLCAPSAMQQAGKVALGLPDSYYDGYRQRYAERRDLLKKALTQAGMPPLPVEGAYYMLADVTSTVKSLGLKNDMELAEFLIKKVGVATIPGSNFLTPDAQNPRYFIRFSFCKPLSQLKEAGQRLQRVKEMISRGETVKPSDLSGPGIQDMLG
jgi:aspartate/methionine/tyrosine aminotransferase